MNVKMEHGVGDPVLESLLDEALTLPSAAPGMEAARVSRILATTEPRLRSRRGVLARLGPSVLSLAATLALAVGTAAWVASVQTGTVESPGASLRSAAGVRESDPWETFDRLSDSAAPFSGLDEQLTVLSIQMDLVGDLRNPWASAPQDSLDAAVLRDELEMVANDLLVF